MDETKKLFQYMHAMRAWTRLPLEGNPGVVELKSTEFYKMSEGTFRLRDSKRTNSTNATEDNSIFG